jgi:ATP-dependent metalloprotease
VGLQNAARATRSGWNQRNTLPAVGFGLTQRRQLWGLGSGGPSQNLLAHLEQMANNNPGSASAQSAFYNALLRANHPSIIVERYQSGRYASNSSCENAYQRALERLGQTDAAAGGVQANSNLSADQLQAVAQAVGARSQQGNVVTPRGGSGAKNSPLYVVVEESTSSTIFRWLKFILTFSLVAYGSLVILTLAVEASGMLRKVGGPANKEARPELQTQRFSDVHGCDEAKEELRELVEFLRNPDRFNNLGGKLPKGVLLTGPPGTGKTLLARAVAGEAGVPFFYMSGSEFDEVYVGVGAKRVRELFTAARGKAPAIVFIDELDAIGGKRNDRDAAYVKQTLNQLLTELDGFEQNSGVIFIAATNFPQLLDKALTRPGRFDRNVEVPLPDVRGRLSILQHHMRNMQLAPDVDPSLIARGTPGFSGADLENLANSAAVHASKNKATSINMLDLEWAKDRILMGSERRSQVIHLKDKISTAYHEGGHTLVSIFCPAATPLYKATIIPRGRSLGVTHFLPEIDEVSSSKARLEAMIAVSLGGKLAEELVYGRDKVTTGAYSDLQQVSGTAFNMVARFGMSEKLGDRDYSEDYNSLSPQTKKLIESEMERIIFEQKQRAQNILQEHRKELDLLAAALVEYELLSADEIQRVIRGEKLPERMRALPSPLKLPEMIDGIEESDPNKSGTMLPSPEGTKL